MAEPREIRVKLTADVSEYNAAMDSALERTRRLKAAHRRIHAASLYFGVLIGVTASSATHIIAALIRG